MANVNLVYFGSVTDITGMSSEKAEVPATLNELNDWLLVRFPGLSSVRYRFSVNRQLITGDRPLANGDEIALLPPFAGG